MLTATFSWKYLVCLLDLLNGLPPTYRRNLSPSRVALFQFCLSRQGSVLGPLLFLVHINDVVSVIDANVSIHLFGNNCTIFKEVISSLDQVSLDNSLQYIVSLCDN